MTQLGAIVLHGLGGTPASVEPLTAALRAGGHPTLAPKLPGHGTTPQDLQTIAWHQWVEAAENAATELRSRCERLLLVGQSMGGTIALHLAARRDDVAGVVTINAPILPIDPDATEHLAAMIGRGRTMQPVGEPDICDPEAQDPAYRELPLRALLEMAIGVAALPTALAALDVPMLVVSGDHDSTVGSADADALVAASPGRASRLRLPRSAHVAALDLDRARLCRELLAWSARLTDRSADSG